VDLGAAGIAIQLCAILGFSVGWEKAICLGAVFSWYCHDAVPRLVYCL
jgi:hypothetical protein